MVKNDNTRFVDSRLKIDRANKHIYDIEACFDKFLDTEYYSIVSEKDLDMGDKGFKFISTKPIPEDIPILIGDAIHNTRASLDLMISQIELTKTGRNTRYSKFPFSETLEELIRTVRGGPIQQCSPTLADFIIDVIKPYKAGNPVLCAIHDLDIIDKHRLIIPTIAIAKGFVDVKDDRGRLHTKIQVRTDIIRRGDTTEIIGSEIPGNHEIKNYHKDTFDIYFDKGLFVENKPVVPTLFQFSHIVFGIIESIEALGICNTA